MSFIFVLGFNSCLAIVNLYLCYKLVQLWRYLRKINCLLAHLNSNLDLLSKEITLAIFITAKEVKTFRHKCRQLKRNIKKINKAVIFVSILYKIVYRRGFFYTPLQHHANTNF
ncbi:MAG: hypothetical protein NZ901_11055 [Geminocystis sp.]|nr:hypothetical protein [Geminocystis sp.]HIK37823.1 hypothetical protein [Geminocystis sp. M7585_C2015_104]MCS7148710.1 hypothetical protein [Geminocystis sp.]MCX8078416.1 hypothetical protein [Geminocystis sp.]MDW8116141.1 hypothetical protein [Geminocystis sp.]